MEISELIQLIIDFAIAIGIYVDILLKIMSLYERIKKAKNRKRPRLLRG
jgi:hypothetical protein